jgi:antitoxin VapB
MPREHAVACQAFQTGPIPREFELPGEEAILRKDGDRLILEPAPSPSLLVVLAALQPLDEEFPPIPDLPIDAVEL